MKRINQLALITAIILTFSSCVKEELSYTCREEIKEGMPTTVTLKYDVRRNDVVTRAAQDEESEYRVGNLYVFIFDGNGAKHEGRFFTPGTGLSYSEGTKKGTVSFKTTTLNHATIVGIANVTVEGSVETAYTITAERLDGVQTLDDLKGIVMEMDIPSVERNALFMMTGYAKTRLPDGQETTDIQIGGTEGGGETLDCVLELDRTDAKVTFNVAAIPDNGVWEEFTFTPKDWSIYEVPQQSLLLPADEGSDAMDADGNYFTWGPSNFEEVDAEENTCGFTFYMPENRKAALKEVPDYAARDESDHEEVSGAGKPGQEYENGAFTYAHEHATYAVLTGVLSYVDEEGRSVNADVRYIIHLGYASGDPNDFDTKRNVHYTYNVTVKGVDNIVVEVTSEDNEVRPGYEGDVVYSANQMFNLDSHYDRCQLVINKSAIEGMTWGVKTPFSSGIHAAGAAEVEPYLKDYKWVKFAINADFGAGENQFVKYPGDQRYSEAGQDDGKPRLLDVQQLIERLKEERSNSASNIFGTGDNVYITAFVEENVYFTNPDDGTENLLLWKESVDKDDRLLHIITDDAVYSADGNSSVVNSLYTFKQKAVRTVFDVNNPDLATAWGLESVMETDRLPMFNNGRESMTDYTEGNTTNNGRKNMMAWVEGKTWTDMIETAGTNAYELKSGYEAAAYACMLRNRDLNGDDVIDANEVRWYLASIDQLVDIYLGEYALDADSRLYPRGSSELDNGVYWHYTSSSAQNDDEGVFPWILWAEEGASRGNYLTSVTRRGDNKFAYRCVRNLGIKIENKDDIPTNLVIVTPDPNTTASPDVAYTFDLSRMNPKARRSVPSVIPLGNHDETRDINRPYVRFQMDPVSRNAIGEEANYDYNWSIIPDGEFKNGNRWTIYRDSGLSYGEGYRIPNQRELLIMATRLPDGAWETFNCTGPFGGRYSGQPHYMCLTGFSMVGQRFDQYSYSNDRQTFIWNPQKKEIYLQNEIGETGYVRCVRDLQ